MIAEIKDLKINYEIYGEGKPFLLIHGYSVDHKLMSGCMEPLFDKRKNYKRIYLDLPGMGKTKAESWITDADIMLDIVVQFINMVIPDENFLIAGESYGGYLTRGIVKRMANRIDGALFICPCIVAERKIRRLPEHVVLEQTEISFTDAEKQDFDDYTTMAVVQNQTTWEKYKQDILCGIKLSDEAFLEHFQQTGYAYSDTIKSLEEKLETPALFLLGKQDSSVGYKDAWDILDNYPRGTFAVLDKSGHNLQIEQNPLFSGLVNEWLDRVESCLKL